MREQYWVRTDDNMSLIFPAGFTAEDLRFTAEVQLEQKGQAGVVSIRGRQEPKAPFLAGRSISMPEREFPARCRSSVRSG